MVKVVTYLYDCDDDFSIKEFEKSVVDSLSYQSNTQQVENLIAAGETLAKFRSENFDFDSDDYEGENCYHDELDESIDLNMRIQENNRRKSEKEPEKEPEKED